MMRGDELNGPELCMVLSALDGRSLLSAARVCRFWRLVALAFPRLWDRVEIVINSSGRSKAFARAEPTPLLAAIRHVAVFGQPAQRCGPWTSLRSFVTNVELPWGAWAARSLSTVVTLEACLDPQCEQSAYVALFDGMPNLLDLRLAGRQIMYQTVMSRRVSDRLECLAAYKEIRLYDTTLAALKTFTSKGMTVDPWFARCAALAHWRVVIDTSSELRDLCHGFPSGVYSEVPLSASTLTLEFGCSACPSEVNTALIYASRVMKRGYWDVRVIAPSRRSLWARTACRCEQRRVILDYLSPAGYLELELRSFPPGTPRLPFQDSPPRGGFRMRGRWSDVLDVFGGKRGAAAAPGHLAENIDQYTR